VVGKRLGFLTTRCDIDKGQDYWPTVNVVARGPRNTATFVAKEF
jgi:hypothetical protein